MNDVTHLPNTRFGEDTRLIYFSVQAGGKLLGINV